MKYGILTTFSDLSPQYSLTSIAVDQARMIDNAGHTPVLFVLTNFDVEEQRARLPPSTEIRAVIPVFHAVDYKAAADLSAEHIAYAKEAQAALMPYLQELEAMIAHDILFLGWNLPLNLAVQGLSAAVPNLIWLHWVHSVPAGTFRDFWQLPEGRHSLVYLNQTDQLRCAEHFRVWPDRVHV